MEYNLARNTSRSSVNALHSNIVSNFLVLRLRLYTTVLAVHYLGRIVELDHRHGDEPTYTITHTLAIYRNTTWCDVPRCQRGDIGRGHQQQGPPLQRFGLPLRRAYLLHALRTHDMRRPHQLRSRSSSSLPGAAKRRK